MSSIQLQSLLSTTEKVSAQLAKIKQDVQKQLTSESYPDVSPIRYIQRAISLRQSFRQIAEGIQAKRNQAQLQKQKIERSKNFYEGLQYYKATLINKIKQSQIDVVDLKQYFDLPLQVEDWVNDFDQIQNYLSQELSTKQRKSEEYQNLIKLKSEKEEKRKSKTNLYQKVIPQKAKKIYEEVMSAANLLDCKELEPISGIVSFKLSLLHEKISNLRLNNTISVSLSQEGIEQLQITILKNDFQLYKKLSENGIVIKQPQTKLIVTSLPGDRLVIGLDRRQDFSNQQVFQRLIHNQLIRAVFENPKNQNERNMNAKYVCVDWLQNSLLNGLLSPLDMINAIKQRVFNLTVAQHMIQNMKKLSFYQVPLCQDRSKYQYQKVEVQTIKKSISLATLQKIKFQEYLTEVSLPDWIDSYSATYDQLSKENKRKGLNSEINTEGLQNFIEILQVMNLSEIIEPNLNNYYKGTFNIHQNKVDYVLIVPFTYPHKPSTIRITNWRGKKEDERKSYTLPTGAKIIKINQNPQTFRQSAYTSYECVVNSQKFQLPEQFKSYQFLMQINLLITLLHYQVDRKQ